MNIEKQKDNGLYTVNGVINTRPPIARFLGGLAGGCRPICIEVGVERGAHALNLISVLQPGKLYLVDHWESIVKKESGEDYSNNPENYEYVLSIMEQWHSVVHIIKGHSQRVLKELNSDFFDLVYLDGDHRKEGCQLDIINGIRLTKIGGMLAGHDYLYNHASGIKRFENGMIQVPGAVHYIFNGMFINCEVSDWWVIVDEEVKDLLNKPYIRELVLSNEIVIKTKGESK